MKAFLFFVAFITFSLVAADDAKAQFAARITKITAETALTGKLTFEDTTAVGSVLTGYEKIAKGAKDFLAFRRGDVIVKITGSVAADAYIKVYSKATGALVLSQLINPIRVVYSGSNGASPTLTQKIAWLQANTY